MSLPFLKWAGGKTQLLPELRKLYPLNFDKYYEPFLGGGAVFFDLKPKNYLISDSNPELINTYKTIATKHKEVVKKLSKMKNSEEYFYKVRELKFEDLDKIEAAARTIYLNRTCFNGLYRVNKSGQFNVPYGRYKNPNFIQEERLLSASKLLSANKIRQMTFEKLRDIKISKNDFIFFDPPYVPLEGYADFKRYTKEQFHFDSQEKLAELFKSLASQGVKLILTNSNTDIVRNLYKGFDYKVIDTKRNINSRGNKRTGQDLIVYANL
jgi:DNA adenine methylase